MKRNEKEAVESRNLLTLLARLERFELPTFWFVARHSIQLSYRRAVLEILQTVERRWDRGTGSITIHVLDSKGLSRFRAVARPAREGAH